jgi:poly(hydroxyalkanoate) depolymerase family esterase
MHLPSQNTSNKKPLVIALHGCNQRANDMAELSGWNKIADQHNFILIYPQQKFSNNSSFCFNWFKDKDISSNEGEAASIKQMIDHAVKNQEIDLSRIYITGLSAGAAMSVAMLCNFPETFQAGASFAGGPFGIAENSITTGFKMMRGNLEISKQELTQAVTKLYMDPVKIYPTLFIYHGEKDQVVDPKNATWLIEQWTGIHSTDSKPDTSIQQFEGNNQLKRSEYLDQNGKVIVTYYNIAEIGHVLPIDPGGSENQGGKMGLFSVDIDFHSTYQVAEDFGLIQK